MGKGTQTKKHTTFIGFLFESWSANLIILANVAVHVYLLEYPPPAETMNQFILYPGNLLNGNFWCIVTSGFIHSGIQHLALNMLGVFIFARIVERRLGFWKTIFVYLSALMISMFFSTLIYAVILNTNVAIIGASGAVMGLMSAAMLLDPFSITYEMILPIPTMFKGWMFFYADIKGFLSAEQDGVSHLAHLCGFLSIALIVYFLSHADRKKMRAGLLINIVSFVTFLILRRWFMTEHIVIPVLNL